MSGAAGLDALFAAPPATFSPTPFWWWSGEPLRRERLRWQLERLVEGGVRNVIVIQMAPGGPTLGVPVDDPPWFGEAWWELFAGVCEDARELGVGVWFYDQLGALSNNLPGQLSTVDPELVGWVLDRAVEDADGACTLSCPDGGVPLGGAAVPLDADGTACGPAEPVALDGGELRWRGRGPHRVMLAYARRHGYDFLSPQGGAALIDAVHGEFERRLPDMLASPIVGSWQEESLQVGSWTADFGKAFAARNGYELAEHVAALWEGEDELSRKVRGDYHATRTELVQTSYYLPLRDWHARHGMLWGCDEQRPARAGHPLQGAQLYGDYVATHRWLSAPGSDQAGDGKVHSSMAHLHRRPRSSLLAFHTSGWGGTLEETFDWLVPWLRAGIDLYVPHAVYYSTAGGWYEWAAPSTCWRQPYWRHYSVYANAVARLCAVLSQGVHCCDVAVLYPTSTVHADLAVDAPLALLVPLADPPASLGHALAAQDAYLALVGRMDWKDTAPGVLDRDRRDFDVIDEASLQRAEASEGALRVAGEAYRAVVLPSCRVLEAATAEALLAFAEAGGLVVIVGAAPELAAGRGGDDGPVRRLAELAGSTAASAGSAVPAGGVVRVASAEDVPAALAGVSRRVDAPVPTLLRRVEDRHVLFVPATHPSATTVTYGDAMEAADYAFDPGRYARTMRVTVRDVPGAPALWDPFTGERRALDAAPAGDGAVAVEIPFDGAPAALLVWGD